MTPQKNTTPAHFAKIFLVGLMGSGKSTIGRALSQRLSLDFLDSDREIEEHTGVSISLIFDIEGESGFRQRELNIIDKLTNKNQLVLATGGGAVLDPLNRQRLQQRGVVIYLSASIERILERTRNDQSRPLLQTDDPYQTLTDMHTLRDPLYRDIADLIIDTAKPLHVVIHDIITSLNHLKTV
jgi:shikimate kinase